MKKFHKLIALCLAVCLLLPTFALRADAADQDASKQTASADNAYAESAENPVVTKHTAENEPAEEDKKGLFKFDLF